MFNLLLFITDHSINHYLQILMTIIFPPLIYFMKFHTTEKSNSSLIGEVEAGPVENQTYLDTNKVNPATESAVFSPSKKKPKDATLRSKFQEVRLFCGDGNSIGLLEAAYRFYKTPVTKFLNNIVSAGLLWLCSACVQCMYISSIVLAKVMAIFKLLFTFLLLAKFV